MAANPTITASVTVLDQGATAMLKKIGSLSKEISREANAMIGGIGATAGSGMSSAMGRHVAEAKEHLSGLKKFGDTVAIGLGLSFAGMMAGVAHASLRVGEEMEKQQQKLISYGGLSAKEAKSIRDQADTAGARLPGGPIGYETAARAASMSGIPKDKLNDLAPYALLYSNETGDDAAKATEDLASHMLMLSHLGKDARGRPLTMETASHEQFAKAAKETMNLLIETNKTAPGNMANVYAGAKFGGPAAVGFHRDAAEFFGFYTEEAKHGIRGDEAGVVYRQAMGALAAPTAKARMAIAAGGLNANDYVTHDLTALTTDNVVAGLSTRVGKTMAEHVRGATQKAIDLFHKDGNVGSLNDAIVTAIQKSGAKNLTDQIKASNVARDIITGSTTTVDLQRFLKDVASHGMGVGALNQIFGKQTGSKIAVVDAGEWSKYTTQYRTAEGGDNAPRALDEWQKSFMGAKAYAGGSMTAAEDKLFQEVEPSLSAGLRRFGDMLSEVAKHPQAMALAAEAFGGITIAATAAGTAVALVKFGKLAGSAAADIASLSKSTVSFASRLMGLTSIQQDAHMAAWRATQVGATAEGAALNGASGSAFGTAAGRIVGASIWGAALVAFDAAIIAAGSAYKTANPEKFNAHAGGEEGYYRMHPEARPPAAPSRHYVPGGRGRAGMWVDDVMPPALPEPGPRFQGGTSRYGGTHSSLSEMFGLGGPPAPRAVAVTGDVKGEASLMQTIKVEPSPLLTALVQGAQSVVKMNLSGKLGQTMKGSNATMPSVAPGLTTFRPTVSGR